MTLDTSDTQLLTNMLTSRLYEKPVESLVRETLSNALDAHIEAGSSKPVVFGTIYEDDCTYYICKDEGFGISPEKMRNVVSKWGASTKKTSAVQHGIYGLGFKSPLAYTESFFINTVCNGIAYQYLMYRGENQAEIALLSETSTTEKSGTTIKVPVGQQSYNDSFESAITKYSAYLKNVVPVLNNIPIKYKMFDAGKWLYSTNGRGIQLLLGDIIYDCPGDLITKRYYSNDPTMAIRIPVDSGVIPVQSREGLLITEETLGVIRRYIDAAYDDIIKRFRKQSNNNSYLKEFVKSDLRLALPKLYIKHDDCTIGEIDLHNLATILSRTEPVLFFPNTDVKFVWDTDKLEKYYIISSRNHTNSLKRLGKGNCILIDESPLPPGKKSFLKDRRYEVFTERPDVLPEGTDDFGKYFREFVKSLTIPSSSIEFTPKDREIKIKMPYYLDNFLKTAETDPETFNKKLVLLASVKEAKQLEKNNDLIWKRRSYLFDANFTAHKNICDKLFKKYSNIISVKDAYKHERVIKMCIQACTACTTRQFIHYSDYIPDIHKNFFEESFSHGDNILVTLSEKIDRKMFTDHPEYANLIKAEKLCKKYKHLLWINREYNNPEFDKFMKQIINLKINKA
jgi:hypothetical protein